MHKARAGAAFTEDALANWQAYLAHRDRLDDCSPRVHTSSPNLEGDEDTKNVNALTPSPSVHRQTCDSEARSDVRHLVWSYPGLEDIRSQHKPAGVSTYEDWITTKKETKVVLCSLWTFACEAGLLNRKYETPRNSRRARWGCTAL